MGEGAEDAPFMFGVDDESVDSVFTSGTSKNGVYFLNIPLYQPPVYINDTLDVEASVGKPYVSTRSLSLSWQVNC